MSPAILIIEDEYALAAALSTVVRRLDATPVVAASGQSGIDKLTAQPFSLVLLDVGEEQLEAAGLVFSGLSPDGSLVEFVELPASVHPYYVATQAHPEFRSRPHRAHPLFAGLVGAALDRQRAQRLVEVERPRTDRTEPEPAGV